MTDHDEDIAAFESRHDARPVSYARRLEMLAEDEAKVLKD